MNQASLFEHNVNVTSTPQGSFDTLYTIYGEHANEVRLRCKLEGLQPVAIRGDAFTLLASQLSPLTTLSQANPNIEPLRRALLRATRNERIARRL